MGMILPNPHFIEELERSQILLPALREAAGKIAEHAKALAPVDSGEYKRGIVVSEGFDKGKATARVIAGDWKSGIIEFGTPTYDYGSPLRRGVESAGYVLEGKHPL